MARVGPGGGLGVGLRRTAPGDGGPAPGEATLRPRGLSVGMRAVLEMLAEHGASPVPAIADRLDLARQGVQRHVDDLLRLGCVETRPSPARRRSVLIALTRSGAGLIGAVRDDELRHLAAMAPDCTPAEITAAVKVLRSLNRDVRRRAAPLTHPEGATGDR